MTSDDDIVGMPLFLDGSVISILLACCLGFILNAFFNAFLKQAKYFVQYHKWFRDCTDCWNKLALRLPLVALRLPFVASIWKKMS